MSDLKHKENCKCFICEHGIEAYNEWTAKSMEKFGWWVDAVMDDTTNSPTGCNIHTHGLMITYKHLDLQIVYPMPMEHAHSILVSAIDKIKNGTKFEDGQTYPGILRGYRVKMFKTREVDRDVLRLILPDKMGSFNPASVVDPICAIQWLEPYKNIN